MNPWIFEELPFNPQRLHAGHRPRLDAELTIFGDTSENVARNISVESAKWRKIIETANIRMDD